MNEEFKEWMDRTNISVDEAARYLGTAESNIYKWRSRGIPEKKQSWLRGMMANYNPLKQIFDRPITVEGTKDQFDAWEEAAFASRMKLTAWAIDALDRAAAAAQARGELSVVPDPTPKKSTPYKVDHSPPLRVAESSDSDPPDADDEA